MRTYSFGHSGPDAKLLKNQLRVVVKVDQYSLQAFCERDKEQTLQSIQAG